MCLDIIPRIMKYVRKCVNLERVKVLIKILLYEVKNNLLTIEFFYSEISHWARNLKVISSVQVA